MGLELSLNTDEYVKLLGLVAHPAVRAYWDAVGTESMVKNNEGIKGIEVIGKDIVQMHLKNQREPLMETPGLVDWSKAWPAIKKSGFEGWFAFETGHASPEACIEDTKKNVAWVMKNAQG